VSEPFDAAFVKISDAIREFRLFALYIDGVEVTQSIQYREADRHLTDSADRGPNNSLPLVADKTALVRVYVRHTRELVRGVVGTVTVQQMRWGVWVDAGQLDQLAPMSVSAEPNPSYSYERSYLSESLNFRISATRMRGSFRLKVDVSVPGTDLKATDMVYVNASLLQTLRVRGIPVRYQGPDAAGNPISLAAPSLADFQATAVTTLSMYPVSQTPDIGLAGIFTWSEPLLGNIVKGECPRSWNNLLFWLGVARVIDGNRANHLYYALFDPGLPTGGAAGCGGGDARVGAGATNDGMTMAHELGHVLGFSHTPCNLVKGDAGDPSYPAYEPYDTTANRMASVGEYGVDLRTMTIHSPAFSRDFMSYCGPRWISIYQMRRLINNAAFDPRILPGDHNSLPPVDQEWPRRLSVFDRPDPPPPWVGRQIHFVPEPDPVRSIVVTGILDQHRIEVGSVLRVDTVPGSGARTVPDTFVEALDANNAVLQRTPLLRLRTHACGCGCSGNEGEDSGNGLVQAVLPDSDNVYRIRLVAKDEEIWSRESPGEPPQVVEVSAVVENCELQVSWQTSASDMYTRERAVQWSDNDGRYWQALAVKLDEDNATIPVQGLRLGTILVRVIVSDGFNTAASEPVAVEIPRCAPAAAILWPKNGATVSTSDPVRLWGLGTASDGKPVAPEDMSWVLDGQRVGSSTELWAALQDYDGEHEALLTVRDGALSATARVVFNGTCCGRPSQRIQPAD